MQLLILSNGHGEDAIAVRIAEELQRLPNSPKIVALPIVGKGHAYSQHGIPSIGTVRQMPSGGFIYMDGRQFFRDIRGGLIQLTLEQYKVIRQWGRKGGKILAVGDIVPLLFAWLSGADYAFVGTAKSDYYLRDEIAWLPRTSQLERMSGSVYLPWERWLMSRDRAKAIFPRDTLTTEILRQYHLPAFDLGNPMMDGLESQDSIAEFTLSQEQLTILLLPGSRSPEAQDNWDIILTAISDILTNIPDRSFLFLAAIAPGLSLTSFQKSLCDRDWTVQPLESLEIPISDSQALGFSRDRATLVLSQNAYADCLAAADCAIAMAGTATEQFIGLGKPAIAIPGKGPQFTDAFAEAQTRLLGCSVILVEPPQSVSSVLQSLLGDRDRWQQIAENGRRRMGKPGAAARIAKCLLERLY